MFQAPKKLSCCIALFAWLGGALASTAHADPPMADVVRTTTAEAARNACEPSTPVPTGQCAECATKEVTLACLQAYQAAAKDRLVGLVTERLRSAFGFEPKDQDERFVAALGGVNTALRELKQPSVFKNDLADLQASLIAKKSVLHVRTPEEVISSLDATSELQGITLGSAVTDAKATLEKLESFSAVSPAWTKYLESIKSPDVAAAKSELAALNGFVKTAERGVADCKTLCAAGLSIDRVLFGKRGYACDATERVRTFCKSVPVTVKWCYVAADNKFSECPGATPAGATLAGTGTAYVAAATTGSSNQLQPICTFVATAKSLCAGNRKIRRISGTRKVHVQYSCGGIEKRITRDEGGEITISCVK